ncbi:MAG: chromosomal replication initiator protein DnaA [bacterium]|nr:chromosomal replication initiator protein DnaA [bacterium]
MEIAPTPAGESVWEACLDILERKFSTPVFETWLKPMRVEALSTEEFCLKVPNQFAKDWVEGRLKSAIQGVIAELLGHPIGVRFLVDPALRAPAITKHLHGEPIAGGATPTGTPASGNGQAGHGGEGNPAAARSAPGRSFGDDLRLGPLNQRYTFEEFVVGVNNRFAHAAALAVAEAPARAYNPLFLYGGVGLGKTHLMHAIGHRVLLRDPQANVVYVSSEKFTNEFIIAIKNNQTVEFRNRYRYADVLLIDDIQFLEGKEQTQEEFFHTFNSLHEAQKQLVISSDRPPKEIQTLENRLRSRFEWGLLTDIQAPDIETREAILRKKAESERVPVPDAVTSFIAKIIPSNIRELEGALIRVVAFASLTKSPISVDLAAEVLKNVVAEMPMRRVTIASIKERVSKAHGLTVKELENQRRDQRLAQPRQLAMYIACELTDASLPQIAREFSKKDHTTVMYARDKIKDMMERDESFRTKVRSLIATIQQE